MLALKAAVYARKRRYMRENWPCMRKKVFFCLFRYVSILGKVANGRKLTAFTPHKFKRAESDGFRCAKTEKPTKKQDEPFSGSSC